MKKPATLADLLEVDGKAELLRGEVVRFMPTGDEPTHAAFACDLPHRKSFSPDAAYYIGPRSGMRFYPEPPDFAAEIRSEGDYGRSAEDALREKRSDYFAAGTQVVWDVDLLSESAIVRKFTASGCRTRRPRLDGERGGVIRLNHGWRGDCQSFAMRSASATTSGN